LLFLALLRFGPLRLGARDRRKAARGGGAGRLAFLDGLFGRSRLFRRAGFGLLLGLAILFGALFLACGGLPGGLFLALAVFLGEAQALFLGLAQHARDALLRGLACRSGLLRRSLLGRGCRGRRGRGLDDRFGGGRL